MGRGNVGQSLKFSVKNPVAAAERVGRTGKSYSRRKINVGGKSEKKRDRLRIQEKRFNRAVAHSDLIPVTMHLINLIFILET